MTRHQKTDFDIARDELLSHIHRCGVLKAATEQQNEWLGETMQYMSERYADLSKDQLEELHQIGRRFCGPVIAYKGEEDADLEEEQGEMAGAA